MIFYILLLLNIASIGSFSSFSTYSYSTLFLASNAFDSVNQKPKVNSKNHHSILQEKSLTMSMTQIFISARSVSYSSSKYLTNTLVYFSLSDGNVTFSFTETYLSSHFLYIFPTFIHSFQITQIPLISNNDKDKIPINKILLFVDLFLFLVFIIITIVILHLKRKKEQKKFIDEYSVIYASQIDGETENIDEQIQTNEIELNIAKIDSPDISWI